MISANEPLSLSSPGSSVGTRQTKRILPPPASNTLGHIGPSSIPLILLISWLYLVKDSRHHPPQRSLLHTSNQARMVYLTMTSAIVAALEAVDRLHLDLGDIENIRTSGHSVDNHAIGNPIAHEQIIAISKLLRIHNENPALLSVPYHLDDLLRGSRIYQESPKPKTEPVSRRLSLSSNTDC